MNADINIVTDSNNYYLLHTDKRYKVHKKIPRGIGGSKADAANHQLLYILRDFLFVIGWLGLAALPLIYCVRVLA